MRHLRRHIGVQLISPPPTRFARWSVFISRGKEMLFNPKARKSRLILLIEHLDAVAYAIEGLEEAVFDAPAPAADASANDILNYQYELRSFVENIRGRELSLIAHVDRARLQARKMGKYDAAISAYARLFNGGTQAFADQMAQLGQPVESDFDGNDQVINFLRCRHLVPMDCLSVEKTGVISISGDYRIAGLVAMSLLNNQCASFLNLIENHELLEHDADVQVSSIGRLHRLEDRKTNTALST